MLLWHLLHPFLPWLQIKIASTIFASHHHCSASLQHPLFICSHSVLSTFILVFMNNWLVFLVCFTLSLISTAFFSLTTLYQSLHIGLWFFGRPYYQSSLWYSMSSVCLSVCLSSVTFCIVAKRCVLAKKCLKEGIGNQGQKVHFFWSPPYFYFRFRTVGHR